MEQMTPAAVIRKNAPFLMIISGILMAFTIGSMGPTSCLNAESGSLNLPNWDDEISREEQVEYHDQNAFEMNYQLSRIPEQYKDRFRNILLGEFQNKLVLLKDAQRKKILATKDEIREKIKKSPQFQDDKEDFDIKKYYSFLGYAYQQKKTSAERAELYEGKIKNEIILDKLKSKVIEKVSISDDEIKTVFHDKFDTLNYEFIKFDVDFKNSKNPTEKDIKDLYETVKSQSEYMSERQAKISYAFFPFSKYEGAIKISDQEIKKYYDDNKKKYIIKEFTLTKVNKKKKKSKKKKKEKKKKEKTVKYKPLEKVKESIRKELKISKSKKIAYEAVTTINKTLSSKPDVSTDPAKNNFVDLEKNFKLNKPANGEFGISEYFSIQKGGVELTKIMGDTTTLRDVAFTKIDNKSIARLTMPKGELLYKLSKENVKEPIPLKLEQVQDKLITQIKQDNGWDEAKKKAEKFVKICESEGWKKTADVQKLKPIPSSADISKAKGQELTIVKEIISKKVAEGKFAIVKRDQLDKFYLAVMFQSRKAPDEKIYTKESPVIKTELKEKKIADTWQLYSKNIQEVAGIKGNKE
ncbi:MAG: hypothetical protein COA79_05025 [Planctomycetota bacterium]|nr:MAG: hypothetical protein COA79_05025 [Planctomycetota bacterium]